MTIIEEKQTLELETAVSSTLKLIRGLLLDKVEKRVNDEDGEVFWVKKEFIPGNTISKCEEYLNTCAKFYRDAGVKNSNKRYRKYSQMVAHIRMDYLPKSLKELLEELELHEQSDNTGTAIIRAAETDEEITGGVESSM